VSYYRRMLPRFLKAKELIDTGRLGKVTGCRYRLTRVFSPDPKQVWRIDPEQSGGGLFLDIGSHALDLLDHLLGEFIEAGGSASTCGATKVEDNVAVHFRTARGITGSASWNFAANVNEELLEIDGTEGRLSMEVIGVTPITLRRGNEVEAIALPDP